VPSSARWLLAVCGVMICLASVLFWQQVASSLTPTASPQSESWFSAAGLRHFWPPFLSGAGLILAVCLARRPED